MINNLTAKFEETESVVDYKANIPVTSLSARTAENIQPKNEHLNEDPYLSSSRFAQEIGISEASVRLI